MNGNERYEEMDQQFNDLPVPDQEQSWQKMKQLLDKDDDNDRILPPILLRSCLGWGALFLVGLTVAWLLVRPEKWFNANNKVEPTSTANKPSAKQNTNTPITSTSPDANNTVQPQKTEENLTTPGPIRSGGSQENDIVSNTPVIKRSEGKSSIQLRSGKVNEKKTKKEIEEGDELIKIDVSQEPESNNIISNTQKETSEKEKQITNTIKEPELKKDTATKDSTTTPEEKPVEKKLAQPKKQFFIATGIGEQQQIPIAGQTAVPYSHFGRKGSLADYIPSVYVRLQKEKKWFIQTEFRYGAAQSVKEFSYNRRTKFDSTSNSIQTTTLRLKKTYYHQLPVTFNYFIKPNLSIGVGGMYSRFFGAITEEEVKSQNLQTQAVTVFKQIVPIKHFTDSFLYKTQVHALLQADYQWKKFSFGLRYTKDIQPFIKYTNPDGTVDEKKNQSLQFIVRYQLWKSKKF